MNHLKILKYAKRFAIVFIVLLSAASFTGYADGSAVQQIPKEVAAIAGTYTGTWTMYGIDDKGQIIKRVTWTDTIKAENPQIKDDRAFVTITDEMLFEGIYAPPRKSVGAEGYLLNKDGSLGDYFMEFGQMRYRMQRLNKDVWSYVVTASPSELASLGFKNIISGQHILVKVITYEQGIETHRISRLTTVNWKDADGKDRWIQFVSLQGFHKRQG